MASINLQFATTRAVIGVLKSALLADPLFQPDKTGPSRSAETLVRDAWGYAQRDFPCLVVTGRPGHFLRMGIGDRVGNYFGVNLTEEPGGTDTLRTFDVPLACVVGANTVVEYKGANVADMAPQPPFNVPVQQKIVGGNPVNFIQLAGTSIGAENFPAKSFIAYTPNYPTGTVFGGMYQMTLEINAVARNTQTRDMLADRAQALLWLEKKRALRLLGVIVLDVAHVGSTDAPYGADKIYQTKLSASVQVEFAAIAQYTETVTAISVVGTAVEG